MYRVGSSLLQNVHELFYKVCMQARACMRLAYQPQSLNCKTRGGKLNTTDAASCSIAPVTNLPLCQGGDFEGACLHRNLHDKGPMACPFRKAHHHSIANDPPPMCPPTTPAAPFELTTPPTIDCALAHAFGIGVTPAHNLFTCHDVHADSALNFLLDVVAPH